MAAAKAYILLVGERYTHNLANTHRELPLFEGVSIFIPNEQPQHPMEIARGLDGPDLYDDVEPKIRREFNLKQIGLLYALPTAIHFVWLLFGMTYCRLYEIADEDMKEGLVELDEQIYREPEEAIMNIVLPDICVCGRADDAHRMFYNALRAHIGNPFDGDDGAGKVREQYFGKNVGDDLAGAMQFLYWIIDARGLAEHGSSAPGWLTFKGQLILALLHDYYKDTEDTTDG